MAETPDEPGSTGAEEADPDPQDERVELDEDGFPVESGRHGQLPPALDVWLGWAGTVVVGVAAYETVAGLISASLLGSAAGYLLVPPPDGYYSLLLLTGVLLLVLRRPSSTAAPGWVRGAACLAVGTGGALVVTQVAGNVGLIVSPSEETFSEPAVYTAAAIVAVVGGISEAVISAFAAMLAVWVYRGSRTAGEVVVEDVGEGGREGGGESEPGGGIDQTGASPAPDRRPRGSVGPAVASFLLGVAVAGACLVASAVGQSRNQVNAGRGPRETTVVSSPPPCPGRSKSAAPRRTAVSPSASGPRRLCRPLRLPRPEHDRDIRPAAAVICGS